MAENVKRVLAVASATAGALGSAEVGAVHVMMGAAQLLPDFWPHASSLFAAHDRDLLAIDTAAPGHAAHAGRLAFSPALTTALEPAGTSTPLSSIIRTLLIHDPFLARRLRPDVTSDDIDDVLRRIDWDYRPPASNTVLSVGRVRGRIIPIGHDAAATDHES